MYSVRVNIVWLMNIYNIIDRLVCTDIFALLCTIVCIWLFACVMGERRKGGLERKSTKSAPASFSYAKQINESTKKTLPLELTNRESILHNFKLKT